MQRARSLVCVSIWLSLLGCGADVSAPHLKLRAAPDDDAGAQENAPPTDTAVLDAGTDSKPSAGDCVSFDPNVVYALGESDALDSPQLLLMALDGSGTTCTGLTDYWGNAYIRSSDKRIVYLTDVPLVYTPDPLGAEQPTANDTAFDLQWATGSTLDKLIGAPDSDDFIVGHGVFGWDAVYGNWNDGTDSIVHPIWGIGKNHLLLGGGGEYGAFVVFAGIDTTEGTFIIHELSVQPAAAEAKIATTRGSERGMRYVVQGSDELLDVNAQGEVTSIGTYPEVPPEITAFNGLAKLDAEDNLYQVASIGQLGSPERHHVVLKRKLASKGGGVFYVLDDQALPRSDLKSDPPALYIHGSNDNSIRLLTGP